MPRVDIFCIFIFVSPVVFEIGFLYAAVRAELFRHKDVAALAVKVFAPPHNVRLVKNEVAARAAIDHVSTSM
jgi:hypothetical protein